MLLIASRSSQDITRLSAPNTQESIKEWRKFRLLSVISLRATESPSMVSDRYGMDGQFFDDDSKPYCLCRRPSGGWMVSCADLECEYEWVGLCIFFLSGFFVC
jgi:hypothetical protein